VSTCSKELAGSMVAMHSVGAKEAGLRVEFIPK